MLIGQPADQDAAAEGAAAAPLREIHSGEKIFVGALRAGGNRGAGTAKVIRRARDSQALIRIAAASKRASVSAASCAVTGEEA
jgi:hypothetical protein